MPVAFTKAQETAIRAVGTNTQIIACAGAGKTEVVARRVAHLLTPQRGRAVVTPANIVAFTFTEKAAAELKDRIVTRCGEQVGGLTGMAEMFVGTIHAFCLELLKTECPEFLKFEVLNEVQQRLFVNRHSTGAGLTTSTDLQGKALRRYVDTKCYVQALGILRESKVNGRALRGCSVAAGLKAYQSLLRSKAYFDYSAIMAEAAAVLESRADVRARLAARIRHVIVDEYQDTNPVQERVVRALHDLGATVCVVGDDDQTLYQWNGSSVENVLTFEQRYPRVRQIRLQENWRSSRGIVATAREFIAQNRERLDKAMVATDAQRYESGDIVALGFDSPEAEAEYIAETIQDLVGVAIQDRGVRRGLAYSDVAILLRSVSANGQSITDALTAADIPFVIAGMNNLFTTAEACAARDLFYYMASPDVETGVDAAALTASWRAAHLGISSAALSRAVANATAARAALAAEDQKRWGLYSIQRVFLSFLEDAGLAEERVPDGRGEIVFYNLGKFSQLISDFEQIHFHSKPREKYDSFAKFLQYDADGAYPEGWQDNQYATPNAVQIMTVHQAKGREWPAVFVPALLRNRFPSPAIGGRSAWHLIPAAAVAGADRYRGGLEDERRLFYVAMTRSQKFLHMTWAPVATGNNRYARPSEFYEDVLASEYVKRTRQSYAGRARATPAPREGLANVVLSFSDLKYFFECPYQFKLRILYGFNAPIHEALGYGKSLHDALAEVHSRATRGDIASPDEAPALVATHLHLPFAYPSLRAQLEQSAERVVRGYLAKNGPALANVEFSEKTIELSLGDGVSVVGRIDLVRRLDTGKTSIVDLKSSDRAQPEAVTEMQLHVYALGYQQLTGRRADYVDIYNLDELKTKRRSVDEDLLRGVRGQVTMAADALQQQTLPPAPEPRKCGSCDHQRLCSAGRAVTGPRALTRRTPDEATRS